MARRYDPSGESTTFACSEPFTIFKADQVIKLANPAFASTISITWFDDTLGTTVESDVPSNYFIIPTEDEEADNAVAVAMAIAGNEVEADFSLKVVTKLTFKGFGEGKLKNGRFKIKIDYQAFSIDELINGEDFDGEGPRYSPSVMKKLLDRVQVLEGNTSVGSLFGTSMDSHDIIEEDLTGIAPENKIQYESHSMNVAAGINYLQPSKGAFYPDGIDIIVPVRSLVTLSTGTRAQLKNKLFIYNDTSRVLDSSAHISTEYRVILTDAVMDELIANLTSVTGYAIDVKSTEVTHLVKGTDYVLGELDVGRTARTHSTQAVYRNIKFLSNINSEVMITYQAFGGEIVTDDIRNLQQQISNTKSIIDGTGILTTSTLGSHSVITELARRIRRMEEYHNHFDQVEHRVSITKPGMHWFSIAAIYDSNWGVAVKHIRDVGQFRIASALRKWVYDFAVDVDVNRDKPGDVLRVHTISSNQCGNNDPTTFVDQIFRDQIAVRLCWIDKGEDSGVVLQIGWDFSEYLLDSYSTGSTSGYPVDTDTIIVTNKSGSASAWTLLGDPSEVNYPSNGLIRTYMHSKYVVTGDKKFVAGKSYYKFVGQYIYVKTGDTYFREGKTYYSYSYTGSSRDTATGKTIKHYGYTEVNSSTNVNAMPGLPTSTFVEDVLDGDGNATGEKYLNLYEKVLFGNYPARQSVTTGANIDDTYYVYGDEYDESNGFSMPNPLFIWDGSNVAKKHYQCVVMLEPEDGIVGWMGNTSLARIAPGYGRCTECPGSATNDKSLTANDGKPSTYKSLAMISSDLQNLINPKSVKAMTIVVFDRRDSRYRAVKSLCSIDMNETSVYSEFAFCLEDMCIASVKLSKISEESTRYVAVDTTKYSIYRIEKLVPGSILTYSYTKPSDSASFLQLEVSAVLGTSSLLNDRFDLRMIKLHF